ncbi:TetR family transcriptional regulator [Hymenobacter sp. HMF4947]|uniref:TetR family transcriptional regulator n=1 Tax=Hymenobacter ginkgonis TaxID=2682976 RepID=A0A7K1TBA1_9BACT|nr:TetR/AcrR family transcriptional regulator [Hymenobacter ginkgonis]MVN75677.1 TetR family transcriptional regulator [Hymenobacter ginkgonis]
MKATSDVRERILTTAGRLFHQQGYNLTGINQIIAEADIARASLYQHFASKDELLLEYLRRTDEAWFAALADFSQSCQTPQEKLLALFDFRMARQQALGFAGCNFVKINAEVGRDKEPVFALAAAHKERLRHFIQELVPQALPQADADTQADTADTLFLLLEGGGLTTTLRQDMWGLARARALAAKLL